MGLTGCGQPVNKTTLKVSLAAVTGSARFPAGLVMLGKNRLGPQRFSRVISASDFIEMELDNGVWDFVAIGWDGTSIFEGNNYCDFKQGVKLEGNIIPLEMTALKENCARADLATGTTALLGATNTLGQFPKLGFNSCGEIAGHIVEKDFPADLYCGPGNSHEVMPGGMKSFRISMGQLFEDGRTSVGLVSACVKESTSTDGLTKGHSNIRLPLGSASISFNYFIEAFVDDACATVAKQKFNFATNLVGIDSSVKAVSLYNDAKHTTEVYMHADLCNEAQKLNAPFGNSPLGANDSRLICSVAQWHAINNDIATNGGFSTYVLGADLDFLGTNTTIANTFHGSLRGNKHIIKNGNQPLFNEVSTLNTTNEDLRISDLKIEAMNISVPANSQSYGILINKVLGSYNTNKVRLEIDRIELSSSNSIIMTAGSGGNIGGLIGEVDFTTTTNDEFFIRNIISKANVDGSVSPSISTGGLFGRVDGGTPGDYYLVLEEFLVGVADEKDFSNKIDKISVIGDTHVGGVVGYANEFEIRGRGAVIADVEGINYVGGLVGKTVNNLRVDSIFVDSNLIASSTTGNFFGGVLGALNGSSNASINDVVSITRAHSNVTINDLGGIAGHLNHDGSFSNIEISNTKSIVDFVVDGSAQGGFIGYYNDSAAGSVQFSPVIKNSIANGNIDFVNSSSFNGPRGGFIGENHFGKVKRSIVDFGANKIAGSSDIGLAFGKSVGGSLHESDLSALTVNCDSNISSNVNCGGAIGAYTYDAKNADLPYVSKLKSKVDVHLGNLTGDCASTSCGVLIGNNVSALAGGISSVMALGSVVTSGTAQTHNFCGNNNINCSLSGTITSDSLSVDGSCGALPGEFDFIGGKCDLGFTTQWSAFGLENGKLRTGNKIEPFKLHTPTDWNAIGTNSFLLTKTFELQNDIDFLNGTYIPLGDDDNANFDGSFSGKILANHFKLRNITYITNDILADANKTSGGLVPMLRGQLGDRNDPLIIENLNLSCNHSKCGVVGELQSGHVSVIVKNGHISGSASSDIGGIVGHSSQSFGEIASSGFEGDIDVANAVKVGGLLGSYMASTGSIRIDESFSKLNYIVGSSTVGGLIGSAPGTAYNVSIEKSYVWLLNGLPSNDDILAGSLLGGFIGALDTNIFIKNSYIDYTLADVPVGFSSIASGGGAIDSSSSVYVIGATPMGIGSINIIQKATQADLYLDVFEREYHWILDGLNLKLEGEVNGYEYH